jgi:peroxiredoxin
VAVNNADEPNIAREFIKEHPSTFPIVLDNSAEAMAIQQQQYQTLIGMTAVPLNYLIGPDGKVADAWYGFDPEHLTAALAALGIK